MSIFFDFDDGPSGRKFRRAIDLDKHEIESIMDKKHTEAIFGDVDIGELIELATLSICLIKEQKKILGFLALHDRPNVPVVPSSSWESWISNMFHCHFLPHNTLFIHLMCCVEAENDVFLDEALKSVFNNDEYLLQVVLVAPPSCTHDDFSRYKPFRKHVIKKIPAKRTDDAGHYIYVVRREDFYPRLSVRAAVEEDNDDIVEILDKLQPSMKKLYGDYYMSEMIGRHPESQRKIVVAQRHDVAVGVMCLNAAIDYAHLSKTYDLAPYFGLKKATHVEKDEIRRANSSLLTFGDPIMRGKRSPFDTSVDLCTHQLTGTGRKKRRMRRRKMSSHVIFKKSTAMRRSFDQFFFNKNVYDDVDKISMSPNASIATEASLRVSLVLDEDPFDYDIVNIEASLLQVPSVLPAPHSLSSLFMDEYVSLGKLITDVRKQGPTRWCDTLKKAVGGTMHQAVHAAYNCTNGNRSSSVRERRRRCTTEESNPQLFPHNYQPPSKKEEVHNSTFRASCLQSKINTDLNKTKASSASLKFKRFKKQAKLLHKKKNSDVKKEYNGKPNAFSIEIYALQEDIDERTENDPRYKTKASSASLKFKRFKKQAKLLHKKKNSDVKKEYNGKPNAFSIEIYALQEDIDERKGYDLLVAAFEIMKSYDYCLLRMPCDTSPMYLLRHFCMIPFKNKVCSDYVLYIAHRSSVLGALTVRKAEVVDMPQISRFLQNLDGKEAMWVVENSILGKNQHEAYVFVCGVNVVGFGVLEPPEQQNYLQARFNMDPFRIRKYHYAGQGVKAGFCDIKAALVYPVFEVHFRFFLREMMRMSGADTLIWLTGYKYKWVIHKANSMVPAMIPLIPRKSEPICTLIPEMEKIGNLARHIMAFSSWMVTSKLTSITRLNIDMRIVVVGASRTAMGFINNLLFSDASSYLTFTSVTLISTSGLPFTRHFQPDSYAEMMFPRHRTTTENYLKSTPYTYYLNVVQATVVEINKQDKYVVTSNEQQYYYDKLFLMFGKQFQHPEYLQEIKEQERAVKAGIKPYTRLDDPSFRQPEIATSFYTPRNVFIVNTMADAQAALRRVKNIKRKICYDKIIVYGLALEVYCCIATLLEMGIPNNKIVFVEPFPPEDQRMTRVPLFNNTYVDQTLTEVFDELEIEVLRSYYFHSWKTDIYNGVTHVRFLSLFRMVDVSCSALFYYGSRDIDANAFLAIHQSGLVYDNGIMITHECLTNNPSIYAAGPATRYCARYFAEMRKHEYYDGYEIGEKLGTDIRNQLDPLFSEKKTDCKNSMRNSLKSVSFDSSAGSVGRPSVDDCSNKPRESKPRSDDLEKLPVFINPIVTHCVLPGGLQYLEVRSPGRKIPHAYVQSLNFIGLVMETFKSGYFKLHMTKDFIVDGITCLSPVKYSIAHFKGLYGKSAVLLNNVHIKYTAKKVDNFYEFFNSRGIMYLYHEHVDNLFSMVKELLPLDKPDGETLTEAFTIANEKYKKSALIRSKFEKSLHVEAIIAYVLEWLSQHDLMLPMYYQPWQRPDFTHDLGRHPAFEIKTRSQDAE